MGTGVLAITRVEIIAASCGREILWRQLTPPAERFPSQEGADDIETRLIPIHDKRLREKKGLNSSDRC